MGGAATLGNTGHGILITSSNQNTIGSVTDTADGNLIRGNGGNGIAVVAPATPTRSGGTRSLATTARDRSRQQRRDCERPRRHGHRGHGLQNFPVLTTAAGGVGGSLNSRPSLTYQIRYFANTICDSSGNGGRGDVPWIGFGRHEYRWHRVRAVVRRRSRSDRHRDRNGADRRDFGILRLRVPARRTSILWPTPVPIRA